MASDELYLKAADAYERKDYAQAFNLYISLAEAGDAEAMSMIAVMYGDGTGVEFDFEQSVAWGVKAVNGGSKTAIANLAIGFRTRGDIRQAKEWFEKAVAAGDGDAALDLAKLYMVSDLERETVKKYLLIAANSQNISEASKEEVGELLMRLGATN